MTPEEPVLKLYSFLGRVVETDIDTTSFFGSFFAKYLFQFSNNGSHKKGGSMKVSQTPAMPPSEKVPKEKTKEAGDGETFQGLLSKACQIKGPADSISPQTQIADPATVLEGMTGVARSQAVQGIGTEKAMQRIQVVLDLLETYQQQLADPGLSLKEMMPVVNSLERQIHDLRRSEDTSPLPADLARIASEIAVTAQVEVSKFHRGDYV